MKKVSYILLALSLMLTFAGCNQKEKKLQQIVLTDEQIIVIRDITTSALVIDDIIKSTSSYRGDTLVFGIVVDTLSDDNVERITKGEQRLKKYLLTALCNESSQVKELLSQIAEVPANFKLTYGDNITEEKISVTLNATEIKDALAKKYKQRDVLGNYFEWLSFYESDEEYNVSSRFEKIDEKDYIVVEIAADSALSSIDKLVNSDIEDAKNNFSIDIDEIIDLDKYKNKISEKYREEVANYLKEEYIESGEMFINKYIASLMQQANVGSIIRFRDKKSDNIMDIVIESNELLGEKNSEK
jgi:hypothetical protein